jgi:purine-binding chemotaxis protein CheW
MINDLNLMEEVDSYLSFNLKKEIFAFEVGKVVEIMEVPKITHVPKAPHYMKGVINLRGKVIPVIDAGLKFGLEPIELSVNSCIIIIKLENEDDDIEFGVMVDEVQEVFEFNKNKLQASPTVDSGYNFDYIKGITKIDENIVMVIDIDKAFTEGEINLKANPLENN